MSTPTLLHPRYSPSAPRASLRIDFYLDKVEDVLLNGFGMRELTLEPRTAVYERSKKADRLGLDARSFAGDGRLARLSVVRGTSLSGDTESVSILALPRPDLCAPVYFAHALIEAEFWEEVTLALEPMSSAPVARPELMSITKSLDASATEARVDVRGIEVQDLSPDYALAQYLEAFSATLEGAQSGQHSDAVRRAQRAYLKGLADDPRMLKRLEEVFGSAARRVFTSHFFDARVV